MDGEEYGKVFKPPYDDIPSVAGQKVCCKFQCRSFCFKNCDRYHGTLTGQTKTEFSKVIQARRKATSEH